MKHLSVPVRQAVALVAIGLLLALAACSPGPDADARVKYTEAELDFAEEVRRIHDVEWVYIGGAIGSGRNACYLLDVHGIDRATLDGWEEHWHQPWEREWLEAAVTYLCPPEVTAR